MLPSQLVFWQLINLRTHPGCGEKFVVYFFFLRKIPRFISWPYFASRGCNHHKSEKTGIICFLYHPPAHSLLALLTTLGAWHSVWKAALSSDIIFLANLKVMCEIYSRKMATQEGKMFRVADSRHRIATISSLVSRFPAFSYAVALVFWNCDFIFAQSGFGICSLNFTSLNLFSFSNRRFCNSTLHKVFPTRAETINPLCVKHSWKYRSDPTEELGLWSRFGEISPKEFEKWKINHRERRCSRELKTLL